MIVRQRRIAAPSTAVWGALADGWNYPVFVVGASAMRAVEGTWPAVGASLHHSAGAWPVLIHDSTTVLACTPPAHLELRARAWPAGEARVVFDVEPDDAGSVVTLSEAAVNGPGALIPVAVQEVLLGARNTETLRRLEALVLRRPVP